MTVWHASTEFPNHLFLINAQNGIQVTPLRRRLEDFLRENRGPARRPTGVTCSPRRERGFHQLGLKGNPQCVVKMNDNQRLLDIEGKPLIFLSLRWKKEDTQKYENEGGDKINNNNNNDTMRT